MFFCLFCKMQKILILLLCIPFFAAAQEPNNWHHLDPETDTVLGISTYRAYRYLHERIPDTVIVAIIDNGIELTHEDLQGTIWVNVNEIKENHTDDDENGYADDIHGWNFLGNPDGVNLKYETLELTRLYAKIDEQNGVRDTTAYDSLQTEDLRKYREIKMNYVTEVNRKSSEISFYEKILSDFYTSDSLIRKKLNKEKYTREDVENLKPADKDIVKAKASLLGFYDLNLTGKQLEAQIRNLLNDLETRLNPDFRSREEIIGDNPHDITDTVYGNNMLQVMGPSHGTGVASVVGALHNATGIDGVARTVKLMILRVVPNGDERDKDVALAIRYALRNGAQIINCSFGKKYSAHPEFVQAAISEAEANDVLIVHAAGNDAENNDQVTYYPSGIRTDNTRFGNWITVGSSMPYDNEGLVARFSNYGSASVDVFAPGYGVMTCTLNNGYNLFSGTSIAAPMVTGVAAVLKSYFPYLTAKDIKDIIIRSVYIPNTKTVIQPGNGAGNKTDFKSLSVSGGIVNLYRAVVLADREYGISQVIR